MVRVSIVGASNLNGRSEGHDFSAFKRVILFDLSGLLITLMVLRDKPCPYKSDGHG